MKGKSTKFSLENLKLTPVNFIDDVAFGSVFKLEVNLIQIERSHIIFLPDLDNIIIVERYGYHYISI